MPPSRLVRLLYLLVVLSLLCSPVAVAGATRSPLPKVYDDAPPTLSDTTPQPDAVQQAEATPDPVLDPARWLTTTLPITATATLTVEVAATPMPELTATPVITPEATPEATPVLTVTLEPTLAPTAPPETIPTAPLTPTLAPTPTLEATPAVTLEITSTPALTTTPTPTGTVTLTPTISPTPAPLTHTLGPAPALALALLAEPLAAAPGDVLTFTALLTNSSLISATHLVLSTSFDQPGLVYVPGSATGFDDLPAEQRLTRRLPLLPPGGVVTGTFGARVQGLEMGGVVTHTLTVSGTGLAQPLTASLAISIQAPSSDEVIEVSPERGGLLRSADRRLELHVPPGAVDRRTRFTYTPLADFPNPQGNMRAAFALTAEGDDGQPISRFTLPVTLTYQVTPTLDERAPAPLLFSLDPASGVWQVVPGQIDRGQGRLEARLEHFSVYGEGTNILPAPAPGISGIQSQLFSGSVSVDYPIEVPPGTGGLAPSVVLHYSSADLAGRGHHQALGWGWTLPVASYVVRNPEVWWEYILVLNGVAYELASSGDGYYHSQHDPSLRAWRTAQPEAPDYVGRGDEAYRGNGYGNTFVPWSGPQTSGAYDLDAQGWYVSTGDGTQYYFAPAVYVRLCNESQVKHRFDKWVLKRIQDTNLSPNDITFTYRYEASLADVVCANDNTGDGKYYVRAAVPDTITYGKDDLVVIHLDADFERDDRPWQYADPTYQTFWTHKRLYRVSVRVNGALARKYSLASATVGGGYAEDRDLMLNSITCHDRYGTSPSSLPATSYTYDTGPSASDRWGTLEFVNNGYGGTVDFVYDYTQCHVPAFRCPLTEESWSGGLGSPAVTTRYAYSGWNETAKGWDDVVATLVGSGTPDAEVRHWFHTDTDRKGREFKSETRQGGTLLGGRIRSG